ncbi:LOW QUALITY PROTEIN: aminopeptidase N-like [Nylanderia fulva]|uniref:LOW QUALITY PROTEIN: aminopeptidase N-like n=1 Tax=Nylanderia fulva TaxID=613905 RepID=UPI0010FB320D|nr:LOW QUALITY PROTEIN: aminopeptidase N-like [Nylanderia fulva]
MVVKDLLTIALLLIAGQSVFLQANEVVNNTVVEEYIENIYRLPNHVTPIHYNIKLIPYIVEGNFTFEGEENIKIKVWEPTHMIAFHTVQLTINETLTTLTRDMKENDVNDEPNYVQKQHKYNRATQILIIRFEKRLDPGIYQLYLKFTGVISDVNHGFYRSFYTDNEGHKVWLAATHFQPVSARKAFPCWDEPAIKATFQFSIKHYPNYTALSNMPSIWSDIDSADGKLWTFFMTTPIMSTNLLGFVIADYEYIMNSNGGMKIWGPRHLLPYATYPLDIAEKATRELERFTNSTVHVLKMDHVSIPDYSSAATENWGMIVYMQDVLLNRENSRSIINTMTITNKLAQQWFGNLVSPAWWDYLWLSKGISTYLKFYITDKFIKEWRLMDLLVVEYEQAKLFEDLFTSQPINVNITNHLDISKAYSDNTYTKSAVLLRMVSHFLREDVFRNGLIKYLQAHEYSSATPDDLWKALQDALDESDVLHDNLKIKEVMDTWIKQAAYPVVTVVRNYDTGEINVTQKRVIQFSSLNDIETTGAWWIPLNYITQSNPNSSSTLATHWLKPQNESLTIEGVNINDWIIVNKQLTGYYRVNYDIINWKRIIAFLNSDDYDKIPILNRAQIIDDVYYLITTKQLDFIIFLEVINYLSREIDPIPWYPVFRIIYRLTSYLQLPRAFAIFKPYFFNLTHKLFEHIGFDEDSDDDPATIKIRADFMNIACIYNIYPDMFDKCRAKATAKLLAYMENPIENINISDQRFICFGLMQANESIWNEFLQKVKVPKHCIFIGCSENLDIVESHINNCERYYIYINIFSNKFQTMSITDATIDFFMKNLDHIIANGTVRFVLRFIIMSIGEDQIEKMKAFAEQRDLDISMYVVERTKVLSKINFYLAKIHNALENNQFSIAMHITLNNATSLKRNEL